MFWFYSCIEQELHALSDVLLFLSLEIISVNIRSSFQAKINQTKHQASSLLHGFYMDFIFRIKDHGFCFITKTNPHYKKYFIRNHIQKYQIIQKSGIFKVVTNLWAIWYLLFTLIFHLENINIIYYSQNQISLLFTVPYFVLIYIKDLLNFFS